MISGHAPRLRTTPACQHNAARTHTTLLFQVLAGRVTGEQAERLWKIFERQRAFPQYLANFKGKICADPSYRCAARQPPSSRSADVQGACVQRVAQL